MSRAFHAILLLLAWVASSAPASAWTAQTRMRMVDEAVRLMPASLRLALKTHREPLQRGMLTPMTRENEAEHRPGWSGGTLDRALESRARNLIEALSGRTAFAEIASRFGALAHFVQDAGFPPGVSETDGARRYAHFAEFCEARRGRFPLVFYGHRSAELERGDFRAFGLAVMRRAGREDRELARAYAAAGDPPEPAAFDDRSVPFAVGSLSYSHTVTDIARAWLAAWKEAGGDLGRTPYTNPVERSD